MSDIGLRALSHLTSQFQASLDQRTQAAAAFADEMEAASKTGTIPRQVATDHVDSIEREIYSMAIALGSTPNSDAVIEKLESNIRRAEETANRVRNLIVTQSMGR